jgi:hypothetical protein
MWPWRRGLRCGSLCEGCETEVYRRTPFDGAKRWRRSKYTLPKTMQIVRGERGCGWVTTEFMAAYRWVFHPSIHARHDAKERRRKVSPGVFNSFISMHFARYFFRSEGCNTPRYGKNDDSWDGGLVAPVEISLKRSPLSVMRGFNPLTPAFLSTPSSPTNTAWPNAGYSPDWRSYHRAR